MILAIIATCLSGCGDITASTPLKFNPDAEILYLQTGTVVENNNFKLEWNDESKDVSLFDKRTNTLWSYDPSATKPIEYDEFGIPIEGNPNVKSAISIEYCDKETGCVVATNSHIDAKLNGRVSAQQIENGIKVTYYFDEILISIPVEYTIDETGMKVSIKTTEISEDGFRLTKVSVAPFLCSVENDTSDSYLFIPSGSGAIAYPESVSVMGSSYKQEIYGPDPMISVYNTVSTEETVKLPVYGVKNQNKAMVAIVEEGAEGGIIEAVAGSKSYEYSTVYSTFRTRGNEVLRAKLYTGVNMVTDYYTQDIVDTKYTVSFTPLYNEKANYVGMAEVYRDYLKKEYGLKEIKNETANYSITLNGGIMTTKSFLGIPYKAISPLTTYKQAEDIVKELYEKTNSKFSLKLQGYDKSGLEIIKLSDNYKLSGALGGVKEFNSLADYCKEKGISAYFDMETVYFKDSSMGITKQFDTAQAANGKNIYPKKFQVSIRGWINSSARSLIAREKLVDITEKIANKSSKLGIEGLGFSSLGDTAYSDFSNSDYWCKKKIASDVNKILNSVKESGKKISVSNANDYAAVAATQVFDTPIKSGEYEMFDENVPFYQIVFKGYVPMSTTAINMSADENLALLSAIESGSTPSWSVMDSYDNRIIDYVDDSLRNGVFSRYKDSIIDTVKELSSYYDAVSGAKIIDHTLSPNGIRTTVYDNGVTVIVNKGESKQQTALGIIEAGEYKIGGVS